MVKTKLLHGRCGAVRGHCARAASRRVCLRVSLSKLYNVFRGNVAFSLLILIRYNYLIIRYLQYSN